MKTILLVAVLLSVSISILAQPNSAKDRSLSGEWQLTTTSFGIASTERLLLAVSGKQITGSFDQEGERISLNGTDDDRSIRFEFKVGNQQNVYLGMVSGGTVSGTYSTVGKEGKVTGEWTDRRAAEDKPSSPRTLDFNPTDFHRVLSADVPPVLRIWPGDTVRTKSIDAGGQDDKSVYRVMGGNPLTGPFYVEGAMPGDVLAITIKRLRMNRDWAMSDSALVGPALTADYASENKQKWDNTR
jgi:amidase